MMGRLIATVSAPRKSQITFLEALIWVSLTKATAATKVLLFLLILYKN